LAISKATVLGVAEGISESMVDKINTGSQASSNVQTRPQRKRKNEALYNKLLQEKLDHLPQEERQLINSVLVKYAHVFHDEETNDFKATDVIEHEILVDDVRPIKRPHIELRRLPETK
jgi:hypothetical protein